MMTLEARVSLIVENQPVVTKFRYSKMTALVESIENSENAPPDEEQFTIDVTFKGWGLKEGY